MAGLICFLPDNSDSAGASKLLDFVINLRAFMGLAIIFVISVMRTRAPKAEKSVKSNSPPSLSAHPAAVHALLTRTDPSRDTSSQKAADQSWRPWGIKRGRGSSWPGELECSIAG